MPMIDHAVRMVLIPRYTAVYGEVPMYYAPFNVKRFAKAVLTGWTGRGIGTSAPTATMTLEQSADLDHWHASAVISPTPESEHSETVDLLDLEWARVKVEVTPAVGQPPGTTIWAVGSFVLRDGAQP